jgi:L-alanine-DL-glutamate epimerase-like enolase superfamily enzyme
VCHPRWNDAAHSISDAISLHSSSPSFSFFVSPPGYSDEKIARLTKEAVQAGFNHFKMKVGADLADDLRRGKLIRSIIDDEAQWQRQRYPPPDDPELASAASGNSSSGGSARRLPSADDPALAGKNAGPTGAVLMIDANQVWDVQQAIDYVSSLAEIKPWCVEQHARVFAGNEKLTDGLCAPCPCAPARHWHLVFSTTTTVGSSRSRRRRTMSLDTRPSGAR